MENKINIIEKAFLLLQKIVQTRFGSAVVGFVLAATLAYYFGMRSLIEDIESYKAERKDCVLVVKAKNDENDMLRKQLSEAKEIARKEAQKEAQQYIDYAFSLIHNMRNEIPIKRDKVEQEIKQLEEKRKEVMQ